MIDFMDQVTKIKNNLEKVTDKIDQAAARSGRKVGDVQLIVVTKGRSVTINQAAFSAGILEFGENYPEDAKGKIIEVGAKPGVRWHMIGHLQSRKGKC